MYIYIYIYIYYVLPINILQVSIQSYYTDDLLYTGTIQEIFKNRCRRQLQQKKNLKRQRPSTLFCNKITIYWLFRISAVASCRPGPWQKFWRISISDFLTAQRWLSRIFAYPQAPFFDLCARICACDVPAYIYTYALSLSLTHTHLHTQYQHIELYLFLYPGVGSDLAWHRCTGAAHD